MFTEQEQELTIPPKIIGAESLQELSHSLLDPLENHFLRGTLRCE